MPSRPALWKSPAGRTPDANFTKRETATRPDPPRRWRWAYPPQAPGSAAYGVSEAFGWHATLEAKAPDAVGFYTIIAAATVIGFGLGFTGISAIHMLVWSAVLNGIVAVPIMAMMMVIVANKGLMGRFKASRRLTVLGWVGTALMAVAVIALFCSFLIG